ncbi:Ig-like domain-containing protein [Myxococcota bacterium]|nr:Ig-like domain-containing protein [Myxococcota bacterium]
MRPLARLTCTFALISAVGCGGGGTERPTPSTSETLEALTLSADLATPAAGETVIASLMGRYADGSERAVAASAVTWRSTDETVLAPVEGMAGQFLAKGAGVAQIIAAKDEIKAALRVTVAAARAVSLEIVPNAKDIGNGGTLKVNVLATYTDGSRETVTRDVAWSTTNPNVLVPSATDKGYLVAFGEGRAMVTATLEGLTATGEYTVTPPAIDYLVVSPQNARLDTMTPVRYTAMGHWSDGRFEDVSTDVTWTVSDPAIATIDENGLALAIGDGDVVISATVGDVTAAATARTVTSNCPYPEQAATDILYDTILPPVFWLDAVDQSGATSDFQVGATYCDSVTYPTILFVVVAGWCPHCPAYMQMVDGMAAELEAEGMQVVYVTIETASGAPANNDQSHSLVERETQSLGRSIRVGDGVTAGTAAQPFGRAVDSVPNAFVVRTRDLRVIAFQGRSDTYLDLVGIAQNPERLW